MSRGDITAVGPEWKGQGQVMSTKGEGGGSMTTKRNIIGSTGVAKNELLLQPVQLNSAEMRKQTNTARSVTSACAC